MAKMVFLFQAKRTNKKHCCGAQSTKIKQMCTFCIDSRQMIRISAGLARKKVARNSSEGV
jgi:hypothetical protein